jgi:hypothetical protein
LHQHAETWGFLYKINELPKKEELIKHCADLQLTLCVGSDTNIGGAPLCDELISIKKFVKNLKNSIPLNIFNFIKKFNTEYLYPNIWVSLRIFLTVPVSVAIGGWSFSKQKLTRSSMSQERLSSLATLLVENAIAQNWISPNWSKLLQTRKQEKLAKMKTFL